jgi:hypothetical protein
VVDALPALTREVGGLVPQHVCDAIADVVVTAAQRQTAIARQVVRVKRASVRNP